MPSMAPNEYILADPQLVRKLTSSRGQCPSSLSLTLHAIIPANISMTYTRPQTIMSVTSQHLLDSNSYTHLELKRQRNMI